LLRHGLPLGIVVLLTTLSSSLPNFFIKHGLTERDLGIFSVIGLTISVGNMAVVSLGQAAFTRLARSYFHRNAGEFDALLGKLLLAGAAIGAVGMIVSRFAGREILTMIFRPEYAERADLLPWIMAAGAILFMAQFVGFGPDCRRLLLRAGAAEYFGDHQSGRHLQLADCAPRPIWRDSLDVNRCAGTTRHKRDRLDSRNTEAFLYASHRWRERVTKS